MPLKDDIYVLETKEGAENFAPLNSYNEIQ